MINQPYWQASGLFLARMPTWALKLRETRAFRYLDLLRQCSGEHWCDPEVIAAGARVDLVLKTLGKHH